MARILIIEDDDLLRDVLVTALELAGHTLIQAENGKVGLIRFLAEPPDLVITDIVMPVQEGVETIMAIRRASSAVPIIAMSGGANNTKLYLSIAARIGARRVLAKPFTPQELLRVIDEVLDAPGSSAPAH